MYVLQLRLIFILRTNRDYIFEILYKLWLIIATRVSRHPISLFPQFDVIVYINVEERKIIMDELMKFQSFWFTQKL